jgi:hypothetical protein
MNFNIDQFNEIKVTILLCYKDYVQNVFDAGMSTVGKDNEQWIVVPSGETNVCGVIKDEFPLIENAATNTDKKVISTFIDGVISELSAQSAYVKFSQSCADSCDILPQCVYFFNIAKVDEVFAKVISNSTKYKEDNDK